MTLPTAPSDGSVLFEQQAAARLTATLRKQTQAAAQAITALYVKLAGSTRKPLPDHLRRPFADGAALIIARVDVRIQQRLYDLVEQALLLGQREAAQYAAASVLTQPPPHLQQWISNLAGTAQARAAAILLTAQAMPTIGAPPTNYRDVITLLANMHRAVTQLDRDIRWSVNAAINQGSAMMADQAGMARMWVSERDACLHCLAYAGETAQPHQPYPGGLTFYIDPQGDPKPLSWAPVWGPPLHPNCRCRQEPVVAADYPLQPWETERVTPGDALKREARRTVLRGWSGSDSMPARVRAASALLALGSDLPKTVKARAAAAVKAGRFG